MFKKPWSDIAWFAALAFAVAGVPSAAQAVTPPPLGKDIHAVTPPSHSYGMTPTVDLPAPLEWAAPAGMPTAPGDPFPAAFTGSVPNAQAPVVAEWNRTVKPGESFTLTGARFTVRAGTLTGSDTRVLLWADNAEGGELRTLQLWKVSENLIMASVPSDLAFGVYLVWVENQYGPGAPVLLNRAMGTWLGPLGPTAPAGTNTTKRIFGQNLSTALGELISNVYLRPTNTTVAPTPCSVTRVEPYAVWFTVPSLAAGVYDVYVHNGHGGALGWSAPQPLTVTAAWQRGTNTQTLTDTGTGDRTADLQAALNALVATGTNGGTLTLGPGVFRISGTNTIPGNVRIMGAGKTNTTILGRAGGRIMFSATNGHHIALQDLSFKADLGANPFYVSSASFSGGSWNQDLLVRNVDFQVSTDTVSKIDFGLQAERFEISGCTLDGVLHGAPIDWWIHDNEMHGGRNEADGAMAFSSQ